MADQKTLYLVDGHAVLYRYHYAFKDSPMRTSAGMEVSAVYGMAKMLAVLMRNYPMTHIGVIFDPPYRTWRKDFYPEYKSNRKDRDDISHQIELAYTLVKTWGIYTGAFRPLEADDVIGILATGASTAGYDVRIATKDKDFTQLVNDRILLLDLGKVIGKDAATVIDRQAVHAKFGVYPEQMVEYLAMLGDTSDNVPGLDGIGPKTAADLLTAHKNIDGIYASLSTLTPAKRQTFIDGRAKLDRNIKLITLALQYQLGISLDDLRKPPTHSALLFTALEELEFYSVIKILTD